MFQPAEAVEEKVFNLAHDLFTFTHRYDQIEYSYRLAERGHWAISVAKKDDRYTTPGSSSSSWVLVSSFR